MNGSDSSPRTAARQAIDPLLIPDMTREQAITEQRSLYETTRVPMLRLGYLLTGSVGVAEELFHDAFEQVVRRWTVIDNPSGYLRLAVVNAARSWGRRRSIRSTRRPAIADASVQPGPDADAIAVRHALQSVSHAEREAIVLRYFVGLTHTEIAAAVGRPVGSVKSHIHRGLRKLEEALG